MEEHRKERHTDIDTQKEINMEIDVKEENIDRKRDDFIYIHTSKAI